MSIIRCRDLSLGYDGMPVTQNLSFEVNAGDYLCVVGENGAGKSTLIKTLLHLTPALSGQLEMGEGLHHYEIGYLPQQTIVQRDFPATVWEIVLSGTLTGSRWKPFYGKAEKQMAKENLKRMGIADLQKSCYRHLSGGQQQRVLLARALCAASKLILLDEPAAGLDPKAALLLYQIIKELNEEGIAVIMVSHDLEAALNYASHILHIDREGSFYGTKEEYLQSHFWKELKQ